MQLQCDSQWVKMTCTKHPGHTNDQHDAMNL